jgi:hypothetical protein
MRTGSDAGTRKHERSAKNLKSGGNRMLASVQRTWRKSRADLSATCTIGS